MPNLEQVNRKYDAMYMTSGDFDERLWISSDPQIQTPSKVPHRQSPPDDGLGAGAMAGSSRQHIADMQTRLLGPQLTAATPIQSVHREP